MAYIIDTYNKYDTWDREHKRFAFELNGQWYAIYEVILFWGEPQLPLRIGQEKNPKTYFIYEREEDAREFVRKMKSYNC